MTVHKAQRRALKAFNKSVWTLINNNSVPSIDFKAVELKTRQDAGEMNIAELKKQLNDIDWWAPAYDNIGPDAQKNANKMKVAELKEQLKEIGASTSGNKKELVKRLADTIVKEELTNALVDATIAHHKSKPTTSDILRKVAEANGVDIPEHMILAHPIATHMRINNIHRNATVANPTGDA